MQNKLIKLFEAEELMAVKNKQEGIKAIFICAYVAIALSSIYYFADSDVLHSFNKFSSILTSILWEDARLASMLYWIAVIILFYLIIPVGIIKFIFKEQLSNYGTSTKPSKNGFALYGIMMLVMFPLVIHFSGTTSFLNRYPFYNVASGETLFPKFLVWEFAYCLQFFALEFFFRGFMINGLRKTMGAYSILVMTIPYCMIHFGKPFPETIAAILAGLILGWLSYKSKSIWLGVLVHCTVALTMDWAALLRK